MQDRTEQTETFETFGGYNAWNFDLKLSSEPADDVPGGGRVVVLSHEFWRTRLALGAAPMRLWLVVLEQGLKLALFGLVVGFVLAFGLSRMMAAFLFEVREASPALYAAIAAALLARFRRELRSRLSSLARGPARFDTDRMSAAFIGGGTVSFRR